MWLHTSSAGIEKTEELVYTAGHNVYWIVLITATQKEGRKYKYGAHVPMLSFFQVNVLFLELKT